MNPDSEQNPGLLTTRRLIWAYCILWLIEGALRKWIVPQFSMALLLVRDPLVLMIYYSAARARVFPSNGWMGAFWVLAAILGVQSFFQLFATAMPADVILFGLRTFFLHIPLIWVVPAVFGRKEIISMGKWMLYLAPFIAGLMVLQFELPLDHWLNAASLKGGAQIGSGMGKIRPPSIFSFITGPIHYFTLCTAFILAASVKKGLLPRWLLGIGMLSILVALSVSGSRSFFLSCVVVFAFGILVAFRSGKNLGSVMGVFVGVVAAFIFLSRFEVLKVGRGILEDRWSSVGEEGQNMTGSRAMLERYGESFSIVGSWAGKVPLIGFGTGSTSNYAQDRTGYSPPVEGEWERIIYEIGPITGFPYLLFRAGLSISLLAAGFRALRMGNSVCLIFASACFLDLLNGNIRQVTTYGYAAVCAGLCLAAYRAYSGEEEAPIAEQVEDIVEEKPRPRGRGRFAVGGTPAQS